ncbi:TetR family transcriptional regulator C-terminal domain-containing protein [Aneurinibacillus sp. BA2021]|nr:TetR family transcriptional regulator C-terminal domain-containing protein [Aneurinibacillus sp. BA2021]
MNRKSPHTDPRILRTRQLLKDAFIELLQEMDIEKITVHRLTERATINRVTFYLHYRDIPDMLEKMAEDMVEDLSSVLRQTSVHQHAAEAADWGILVALLEYIAKHAAFYKTVLASRRVPIFRERLLLLTESIITKLEEKGSESPVLAAGVQKDVLVWYVSSALIGTIVAWLRSDMPYSPSCLARQISLLHHRQLNVDLN